MEAEKNFKSHVVLMFLVQRVLWRQNKKSKESCMDNVSGAKSAMEAKQFVEETCMDNVSGAKGVMEAKKI